MPVRKLTNFLDDHEVKYVTISHSKHYTAPEIAASAHIPGKELAKTVMFRMDDRMAMAVVPSSSRVNIELLQAACGAARVDLATEREFKSLFPECETGAMPPFGNLYEMPVFADTKLAEDAEIAFNAGTHTELIRLAYRDFERLVRPKVARITY
jgi:Ala-tRNA(Pro) deacylase